jgi:tryptophan synthase beta chain
MNHVPYRIYLNEQEIPRQWYNLRADMKESSRAVYQSGDNETGRA